MCCLSFFLQVAKYMFTVRALQYTRVIVPCHVVIWGAAWRSVPTALPISPHLGCFEKVIQITWQNVEQIRMKGSLKVRFIPLLRISVHSLDFWSSLKFALLEVQYYKCILTWCHFEGNKQQEFPSPCLLVLWSCKGKKSPSRTHNGLRPSRLISCVVDG